MMLNSVTFIIVLLIIFIAVILFTLRVESAEFYYKCFKRMQFKYSLSDFKCFGTGCEECKHCPYYKRYQKQNKNPR